MMMAGKLDRTDGPGQPAGYVTLVLAGQLCGVPVVGVRDILREQPIARVPLAPPDIAGNLNLRGRIVTAVDVRRRLQLPPLPNQTRSMAIVTEQEGELYALLVDQVCEVIWPDRRLFESRLATLSPVWSRYCTGLYRLENNLMIVLDLTRLVSLSAEMA